MAALKYRYAKQKTMIMSDKKSTEKEKEDNMAKLQYRYAKQRKALEQKEA